MIQKSILNEADISGKILLIRGKKVMLDRDLAAFYGVSTGNLNKAVIRNLARFPEDFMFQLTKEELNNLIFQNGISRWGGVRKMPYAFTEHGIAMLSGVLKSQRAVEVNLAIIRIFIRMREILMEQKDIHLKLEQLEQKLSIHDQEILNLFHALRKLLQPPLEPWPQVGFKIKPKE